MAKQDLERRQMKSVSEKRYDSNDTEKMSYSGIDNTDDDQMKTPAMREPESYSVITTPSIYRK